MKRQALTAAMKALGIRRWFRVLEIQPGTGMPHWHVLGDASDLPGRFVRIDKAAARWDSIGRVHLADRHKHQSPEEAVTRVALYMTKRPKAGFPAWVMGLHSIRFTQKSQALSAAMAASPSESATATAVAKAPPRRPPTYRPRRTNAAVVAECGASTKLFDRPVDGCTGEARMVYAGTVPASREELLSRLPGRVSLAREGNHEVVLLVLADPGQIRQEFLDDPEWLAKRHARHADRERRLLAEGTGTPVEPSKETSQA
jgi:hypothetical protein